MRALTKMLVALAATALLVSCGGGGGGGQAFTPSGFSVTVNPSANTSTPLSLVPVTVTVRRESGAALPDGTTVTLRVSPAGVALVSSAQNAGPNTQVVVAESVTGTLSGGAVNFRLHTRAVGTASLTASVVNPDQQGQTVTGNANVAINAGAPTDPRISIAVQSATIPLPPPGISSVYVGSPYVSEVTLTQRRLDGTLVSGATGGSAEGSQFCNGGTGAAAAIGSGLNSAALWLPAEGIEEISNPDGTTTTVARVCRSISLGVNSGRSVFYVVALDTQGSSQLTVTAQDPQTNETLQALQTFNITNGAPQLPGSIVISANNSPLYITGVNGAHAKQVEVFVYDGGGTVVPNPAPGVNNVRLEIVNGSQGGERLRGVNGAGAVVQGDSITLRSAIGIANATFEAGTVSRALTLRATTDRSDNNIDNGISDPITSTRQITVSDGRIFAIDIQNPGTRATNGGVTDNNGGTADESDQGYVVVVRAKAVDRFGTAVPAGGEIRFGLIDEPQVGGTFRIAGTDGNPQEGGTQFTAPTGQFTTAAGGAGPGDTLVLFSEDGDDDANRDTEAARPIASIQSGTSLTVAQRFNLNDVTGTSVDSLNTVDYVIGRATDAAISAVGQTDSFGVATALLSYPRGKVGKRMIIWAQANADQPAGTNSPEQVADVEYARFQGAGPLKIIAPSAVLANRSETIRVCVVDATNAPLQSILIGYSVGGVTNFTVDGSPSSSGSVGHLTDATGCVDVLFTSQGVTGGNGTITWKVDDVTATTTVNSGGAGLLIANPSNVVVSTTGTGVAVIQLRLVDGNSVGIPGVAIGVTCTAAGPPTLVAEGIGLTNASGITFSAVNFADFAAGRTGQCVYTAGTATVTVPFNFGTCPNPAPSPPPPGC